MLSPSQQTRLQHQHETIIELTKGLSEQELRTRPETGKWSPFENMVHLASYQEAFIARLKRIQKEDNPSFGRYVAEQDPRFEECCQMDLHQLNEHLFTHRFLISNHLSALSETDFRRTAMHPVYGKLNVTQWLEFFLLHEAHHLFTIFRLLNSNRS
jgi:hypothetical protein